LADYGGNVPLRPQEINPSELPFLFKKEFELCNVKKDETVVLIGDLKTRPEYIGASFAAAGELGASIYEIKIPNGFSTALLAQGDYIMQAKGALQAVEAADLCVFFGLPIGSDMMEKARAKGTRFLLIMDHPDDLRRLLSPPGLKEACIAARDRIQHSKELRVTSEAGTDLRAGVGDMTATCQYGYSEAPGRMDHWGAGHCTIWPNHESAEGTVVLKPGDSWCLPYVRYIEHEVRLTIKKGKIVDIEGKTDAALMRQYFRAFQANANDDRPWHVGHLGWGLNPNGALDQIALVGQDVERLAGSGRSWAGSFCFSTGPNDVVLGKMRPKPHIDAPMMDCTVMLDGQTVIERGEIVDPKMKVKQTSALRLG
jgi:2,5-dihydroxypyridine 5,6-dioxygenase